MRPQPHKEWGLTETYRPSDLVKLLHHVGAKIAVLARFRQDACQKIASFLGKNARYKVVSEFHLKSET